MKINYYSIFDCKKHEASALFPAASDDEAKRTCVHMFKNPALDVRANVRDLSLYLIGTFTTKTAGNPEYDDDLCFGFLACGETLPDGVNHPNVKICDFVDLCSDEIIREHDELADIRDALARMQLTIDDLTGKCGNHA